MKAHRRSWMLRVGVVAILAAGSLAAVTAPAFAAQGPTVTIMPLANGNLQPGSQTELRFTVKSDLPGGLNVSITSSLAPDVTLRHNGADCGGTCTYSLGGSAEDAVTLVAAQNPTTVPAGQQKPGSITISVSRQDGTGDPAHQSQAITLQGPAAPPPSPTPGVTSVTQVAGTVKDGSTGAPIPKATVALQDSQNHNYTTTTNNAGYFVFKSTPQNPIAPGVVAVGVQVDGYQTVDKTSPPLNAGQSYTFQVFGLATTAASASAVPSTADSGAATGPSDAGSTSTQSTATTAAKAGSGGGFSTILIALGAVLILLGIGAVVYILARRRRDGEDDPAGGPGTGPVPVGAGRAGYGNDATAVARSGGYGEPTMVTGRDPLADAPTMLQNRPPLDEYPDPYAAPAPVAPRPGYGDATQQYGGGTTQQYGGATQQYGGATQQYGGGYDEATRYADRGGYEPRGHGGYEESTRYADRGGYGGNVYGEPEPPAPAGYDEPTGYADRGGYDQPAGGGYEPAGGHQPRDEYEPRRGHQSPGGYESPRGYDEGHARHGGTAPDSRRQLDWLDD